MRAFVVACVLPFGVAIRGDKNNFDLAASSITLQNENRQQMAIIDSHALKSSNSVRSQFKQSMTVQESNSESLADVACMAYPDGTRAGQGDLVEVLSEPSLDKCLEQCISSECWGIGHNGEVCAIWKSNWMWERPAEQPTIHADYKIDFRMRLDMPWLCFRHLSPVEQTLRDEEQKLQERLEEHRGQTGELQISLMWDTKWDNLNLMVQTPEDGWIQYWGHRSAGGGHLDVVSGGGENSLENVYFDKPQRGRYLIHVQCERCHRGHSEPIKYTLMVKYGDQKKMNIESFFDAKEADHRTELLL